MKSVEILLMPSTMNLPIRALYDIRAFSRPASRPDWRTCKNAEAAIIKHHEYRKRAQELDIRQLQELNIRPLRLVAVVNGCGWNQEIFERIPVRMAVRVRGTGGGGNGD
jgi:hypothetical protein